MKCCCTKLATKLKSFCGFAIILIPTAISFSAFRKAQYFKPMGSLEERASDKWPVVFRDDFETIDRSTWGFQLGNNNGWGNGEKQVYTDKPDNAYIQNNTLHVRLQREADGTWTSARMTTRDKVHFTYGRVDARVRTNRVDGPFCAVWALSTKFPQVPWPTCGEIDIFEMQTAWPATPASLHFDARHAGNPVSFTNKIDTENWHVYSFDWTPDYIAFFHDDRELGRYKKPENANQHTWPFDANNSFNLIVNNAIHPSFGSKPDETLSSHVMEVDYIEIKSYPN